LIIFKEDLEQKELEIFRMQESSLKELEERKERLKWKETELKQLEAKIKSNIPEEKIKSNDTEQKMKEDMNISEEQRKKRERKERRRKKIEEKVEKELQLIKQQLLARTLIPDTTDESDY
jgi:hypothetical protein